MFVIRFESHAYLSFLTFGYGWVLNFIVTICTTRGGIKWLVLVEPTLNNRSSMLVILLLVLITESRYGLRAHLTLFGSFDPSDWSIVSRKLIP